MASKLPERDHYGCVGVILPIIVAALGLRIVINQRAHGKYGSTDIVGESAVCLGLWTIGLAFTFHAWHFGPYKQRPVLRWLLVFIGVGWCLVSFVATLYYR